jgi:hypothetical protein
MKKNMIGILSASVILFACNKNNTADSVTLTASSTEAAVGQTVSVTASTSSNTIGWTASPASSTTQAYSVTTEKTNYFTFSKPGDYVVGVRVRDMHLDSLHHCNAADSIGHHVPDSIWNHRVDSMWHFAGHHLGGCRKGQDSASIVIKVK